MKVMGMDSYKFFKDLSGAIARGIIKAHDATTVTLEPVKEFTPMDITGVTDELLLKSAELIKEHCKKQEPHNCKNCILHGSDGCRIYDSVPEEWRVGEA